MTSLKYTVKAGGKLLAECTLKNQFAFCLINPFVDGNWGEDSRRGSARYQKLVDIQYVVSLANPVLAKRAPGSSSNPVFPVRLYSGQRLTSDGSGECEYTIIIKRANFGLQNLRNLLLIHPPDSDRVCAHQVTGVPFKNLHKDLSKYNCAILQLSPRRCTEGTYRYRRMDRYSVSQVQVYRYRCQTFQGNVSNIYTYIYIYLYLYLYLYLYIYLSLFTIFI